MPFTFKLSQRLARMRIAGPPSILALAAGERSVGGPGARPQPGAHVVKVVVACDAVAWSPSQNHQVVAYGRTAAGERVAVAVRAADTEGSARDS
ncbi:MAG TPA: hypothetical protein VEK86_06895 [Gemmatimonadales bacterium]|nr:hypothetical protein [Gemmatimonadales bacterium]